MENITEEKNPIKINSLQNYRNEYLFSEIYLQEIIERPVTDENLRASLQTIKEWREYADKTSLEKWTTTYIDPVLDTLGFGHHRAEEKIFNILFLFPDVDKTKPMSICYVVPPSEDINCTIKGKHWAEKIIGNLRKHHFEWGILTDGIYWRIYHTKEPTPYETYVEVNLETILNSQDYVAFQIFYFFFRPDNFVREENGECKFDIYKEESTKTTEYIEENLRAAIEREEEGGGVLQTLCRGYLNTLKQDKYSEEERQRIYGSAILYLFRLLFLFYSTARNLLKSDSIEAFKNIVLNSLRFHNKGGAQSNSCDIWFRLQDLFAEIDLTYDGGLFNPYENNLTQFIEETRITDPFISEVIFGLGYYQKSKGNFVPIEYRDLSVRHLGSLYEGLLEHKLFIASEVTVVRKSGNKVSFIPQSQAGRISRSETIIEKGKVYFSEDAKERKLSGSYYTPEDVVEYIIKNTVDALLEEKKQELMANIEPVLKELDSAINESERKRLELFTDDKVVKFIEEKTLSLSILDPTMGSGHFLVNATNHIANFIAGLLNEFPGYNPKISSDPAYWRRRVVEDCIYGVDLNPLAVELAKLCLWITTAFKEKPLSFLNHHLKQGNALVGVRISDLEEYFKKTEIQCNLFMQSYLNSIKEVAKGYKEKLSKLTEAREDIEEKKEILAELDDDLSLYKNLYNCFTHYLLGELKETDFLSQIENWKKQNGTEKITASLNSKDFFHWDLEFPDVFYGDNPGFDCVIGNPPYVGVQDIVYEPLVKDTKRCANSYAFVLEKSIYILNRIGIYGFIIPMSTVCTERMKPLQNLLNSHSSKIKIANFAERPSKIFQGVEQKVSITLGVSRKEHSNSCQVLSSEYIQWNAGDRKFLFEEKKQKIRFVNCGDFIKPGVIPKIGTDVERNILKKLFNTPYKIGDVTINKNSKDNICYHAIGRYWLTAFDFIPLYKRGDKKGISSDYKILNLKNNNIKNFILLLLNSSLFYWYWIVYSDCFHLTKNFIEDFPMPFKEIKNKHAESGINKLSKKLMLDYQKKSDLKTANYSTGRITYQSFFPSRSKNVIDEIDFTLGKFYILSEDEINYVCGFHSNFRISGEES